MSASQIKSKKMPQKRATPALIQNVFALIQKNPVLSVALLAAGITACFVPPDAAYLDYFDLKTLTCLFSTLAVVGALRNIRFFTALARRIVSMAGNLRTAVFALVSITFLGSMLIANDMALLTFLPLGYFVLDSTGQRKHMALTFILQNIAANLGGMLTPFGNPQNLYLYSYYHIPTGEFLLTMLPPFLLSIALIYLAVFLFFGKEPLTVGGEDISLPPARTAIYLLLFAYSILIVFRTLPYQTALILIPVALLFLDRRALLQVDYALLFTFCAFFVFSGNMSRIEAVRTVFSFLLEKSTLLFSVLSCQIISNVPSAILLSRFTDNYRALLLGVNIGGTGTLIASLASLITFRTYVKENPGQGGTYLRLFTLVNAIFLVLLCAFCFLLV